MAEHGRHLRYGLRGSIHGETGSFSLGSVGYPGSGTRLAPQDMFLQGVDARDVGGYFQGVQIADKATAQRSGECFLALHPLFASPRPSALKATKIRIANTSCQYSAEKICVANSLCNAKTSAM